MGSWLILVCLPLVASQAVPFFRPDNVTRVTGQVLCGSTPAAFLIVEWWEDRGQQIDVLLGSTCTDGRGSFQVETNRPAPAKSYLFIKNNCGSQREQSSRFEVNLLSPFNMQIQLQNNNNGNGPNQVSGTIFCGSSLAPNTIIEWWADRGSQVDALLGLTQSDARGSFVFRTNTDDARTYLIARSMWRKRTYRSLPGEPPAAVQHAAPAADQHLPSEPLPGLRNRSLRKPSGCLDPRRMVGRSRKANRRSAGLFADRWTRILLPHSKPHLGPRHVIKHSCGSNRQRTSTFRVNSRDSNNMQIQLLDGRNRSSDSRDSRERGLRTLEEDDDALVISIPTTTVLVEPTEIVDVPVVV